MLRIESCPINQVDVPEQRRSQVDRHACWSVSDAKVQVGRSRVAGIADFADFLPGGHGIADLQLRGDRGLPQVKVSHDLIADTDLDGIGAASLFAGHLIRDMVDKRLHHAICHGIDRLAPDQNSPGLRSLCLAGKR